MEYRLAKCCSPEEGDEIIGFLKQESDIFSVHKVGCSNLARVPSERLVALKWSDIMAGVEKIPPPLVAEIAGQLDGVDYVILAHHRTLGVDYAAAVAHFTGIERGEVFARHRKLRELGLLERVEPRMIQYRKGMVNGKWIKHRNHTYYGLTALGNRFLDWH